MTEHDKWRHIVAPYLKGNGIELATGGDSICPTSIAFELSELSYERYNNGQLIRGIVHWRDDHAIENLPFKDGVLDYLFSSHLLEDFFDWTPLLKEWTRVLKPGGTLAICLPDKLRWRMALSRGQTPNCAHRHEAFVGELSSYADALGWHVVCDQFTDIPVSDYNIFFCAQRL